MAAAGSGSDAGTASALSRATGASRSGHGATSMPRTAANPADAQPPSGRSASRVAKPQASSTPTTTGRGPAAEPERGRNTAAASSAAAPATVTRPAASVLLPGVTVTQRSAMTAAPTS